MKQDLSASLTSRSCQPCKTGTPPLHADEIIRLIQALNGWELEGNEITRTFGFSNYYETIAFVNAVAWIVHREDHHPDLEVGYNRCHIRYSTHSVGGLSENDFICAAKIDLLQP